MYKAHSASITAVSVSPVPPPPQLQLARQDSNGRLAIAPIRPLSRAPSSQITTAPSGRSSRQQQPAVPPTPSNQIYIATSSIDGHVCVSSLVDPKDVTLRNFSRPVQAVALSPEYKTDRTYLSGGLAGNLILTVGGKAGVSADANTSTTAAAAGWFGFGGNTGKDTILHSGEGSISTIKFSTTSTFVAWVNEHGIKIMRSHLKLESAESESAWKRIAHIDRPNRGNWDDMASVWKPRIQWIDDRNLEPDDETPAASNLDPTSPTLQSKKKRRPEKLLVGWGDTAWVIHVQLGAISKNGGTRAPGKADIVHKLTFDDCVVSGLSLYTPSLLAVLAYRTKDDDKKPIQSGYQGRHKRQSGLQPELRLINAESGEEVDVDTLTISRYESLSPADYQLETLYIPPPPQIPASQRGALESVGAGIWEATTNASRLISSNASILSIPTSGENGKSSPKSPTGSISNARLPTLSRRTTEANPFLASLGLKTMIFSPYDCCIAIKRDLSDHLDWMLSHERYGKAWELVDEHPSIVTITDDRSSLPSSPSTPSNAQNSLADFFADETSSQATMSNKLQDSAVTKEKQRIGDLWLQQLVNNEDWTTAGKVAGKVLGASPRWEHWVLAFAQSNHFDEITPYIPSTDMKPALPSFVYEVVLGHYIAHDPPKFRELLDQWSPDLFDVSSVKTAITNKLESGSVSEESEEGGEQGRDWRILLDGLAKLHLADGRPRDALHCYIRLQNADAAMALIGEYHLGDAISDDIPGLLMLRVSREQIQHSSLEDLEESSSEVVRLLVEQAYQGVVHAETVVSQLEQRDASYRPFIYFYFRCLWQGRGVSEQKPMSRADRRRLNQQAEEGKLIVEQYGDLAVEIFSEYDRELLMDFLRSTIAYTYERASNICEEKHFIPELVYLLSKTGQTRRALFLIIGELGDVSQAISFTKEHPDLWDDLLDYSMDKPRFIRALLEEVGTAIDPITLVRRIPDGLEIEGLRDGIGKMIREYEIQYSISDGVAKVLRGEVASGMDIIRAGQKKAIKFEVYHEESGDVDIYVEDVNVSGKKDAHPHQVEEEKRRREETKPGHCVGCKDAFDEEGMFLLPSQV